MVSESPTSQLGIDAEPGKQDDLLIILCAAASAGERNVVMSQLAGLLSNFRYRIGSVLSDEGGFTVGATAICTDATMEQVDSLIERIEALGLREMNHAYVPRNLGGSRHVLHVGKQEQDDGFLSLGEEG